MLRPRAHIWILFITWLLASGFGSVILLKFDPVGDAATLLGIFYFFVFLWVASGSAILGYFLRIIFWRSGVKYEFMRTARRQGMWFGLMVILSLFLYANNIFSIWTGVLLVVILGLAEFYFLARV